MSVRVLSGKGNTILDFCKLFGVDKPETVRSFNFNVSFDSMAVINVERFVDEEVIEEGMKVISEKYRISIDKIEEIKQK